ncbi:MAG: MFS transporter [Planctomycetota bacterium]|nr:MFS transporter [Planctomycetota bacterium]
MTRKYALYALAIIFFGNFLNYLDRMLVSALEKPVSQALQLTGVEFGLLWTLFTFGYILSAPFVGFFTDRYRRTLILAICIFILSGATILCGLAQSKTILYLSRFLIGLGEAGCLIIGPTLISDFFLRKYRGRVLSIFYLGLPLGGTAAYVLGGFFEKFGSWREAFIYAGIPGILLAVFVGLLKEPKRGKGEGEEATQKMRGLKPYVELLRTKTLMYIIFAEAFAVIVIVPILHFGKGFFEESRGLDPLQASLILGVIALRPTKSYSPERCNSKKKTNSSSKTNKRLRLHRLRNISRLLVDRLGFLDRFDHIDNHANRSLPGIHLLL